MPLMRALAVLLALVGPLPALGLEGFLPCAEGCAHCGAPADAEPAGCGCEESAAAPEPGAGCACVHEPAPDHPAAPAPAAESVPAPAWVPCLGACGPHVSAAPRPPRPAERRPGPDPPRILALLCVWRK